MTRGNLNLILYQWASKNDLISILFNHKIVDLNFQNKEIVIERFEEGGKKSEIYI